MVKPMPLIARCLVAGLCLTLLAPASAQRAKSIQVLPQETVAFLSIPDVPQARENWKVSSLGKLSADPQMQPFVGHLKTQLKNQWFQAGGGNPQLTWDDFISLPSGEFCYAVTPYRGPVEENRKPGTSVSIMMLDVAGREAQTQAFLQKLDQDLTAAKATKKQGRFQNQPVTVYQLPPPKQQVNRMLRVARPEQLVYFIREDWLVFVSEPNTALELLINWKGQNRFAANTPFTRIQMRLGAAQTQMNFPPGDARWFLDPMGYLDVQRADFPRQRKRDSVDPLLIAKKEGFGAVLGIGGDYYLDPPKYDTYFHIEAYAPQLPAEEGVQVLSFVNAANHPVPDWVRNDVAGFYSWNYELEAIYNGYANIFDEIVEEDGAWKELVEETAQDPAGPRIHLKKDLVDLLGKQAKIVPTTDLQAAQNQEMSVGIPTDNAELLKKNIARSLEGDPTVTKHEIGDHIVWEMREQQQRGRPGQNQNAGPPTFACVAFDHLFVSGSLNAVKEILAQQGAPLTTAADYQQVIGEVRKLSKEDPALLGFSRMQQSTEPTWQLFRAGKLQDSQTLLGALIREVIEAREKPINLNGKLLPPFAQVKNHFGLFGIRLHHEQGFGWFLQGLTINPQPGIAANPPVQGE